MSFRRSFYLLVLHELLPFRHAAQSGRIQRLPAFQKLESLIAKAVSVNRERNFAEKDLQVLIGAAEIQTQRPSKNQRKFYSGKKKKHTQKVEIMTDLSGKILCISKSYPGRAHDFKIRKQSSKIPKNVTVLADSGYQGLQKIHFYLSDGDENVL